MLARPPQVCWHRHLGIKFRPAVFSPPHLLTLSLWIILDVNLCAAHIPDQTPAVNVEQARRPFHSTNLLRLNLFV